MEAFLKAKGFKGAGLRTMLERLGHGGGGEIQLDALPGDDPTLEAGLAWHVRAWGRRTLAEARKTLTAHYPTYAEYAPLAPGGGFEARPPRLLQTDANGNPILAPLNAGFDDAYLKDPRNPRWVAKPAVAYLWARTVVCKNCRARVPLLKTRWLCRKEGKRVLLTVAPDGEGGGVVFGVRADMPRNGGNAAQRREHDKRIGAGTMTRAGAACPCCGAIATMEDIRLEGRAGRLGAAMTAVVVDGPKGKSYRLPVKAERQAAEVSREALEALYAEIPFGLPEEPICADRPSPNSRGASGLPRYGLDTWRQLFTDRQLLALGTFARELRCRAGEMDDYSDEWREAVMACLAPSISRLADRGSTLATWTNNPEKIRSTFARFALPMVWDYVESCPLEDTSGGFVQAVEWIARVLEHLQGAMAGAPAARAIRCSAVEAQSSEFDAIVTDPPYYDAIPYSDLMDFFHVWLRRALHGISDEIDAAFAEPLGPKWDRDGNDGELVDQPNRFDDDKAASKRNYEDGMARAFGACHAALKPDGRLVVVFANKSPDAWETLAAALIRAGFVVDGSWPIQTEMQNKLAGGARLASSVWLVCRKRPAPARPGWDAAVLAEMRENIARQLRDFWDAGIRGPDFVWAATGPALEAFSKYPVVKMANDPNRLMTVSAFLREVRRTVVDFVVGRVLTRDGGAEAVSGLDDATTYYLLHRHDFGMADAPVGACILYALSCNLSDSALANQYELLGQAGKARAGADGDADETGEDTEDAGENGGSGAKVRLKAWDRRRGRNLGLEAPGGHPPPLIDQAHKLMHLWRAGDQPKVDDYLDTRGLKRNALFNQILQALVELAAAGSEERSIIESLCNHLAARERTGAPRQTAMPLDAAP